MNAVLSKFKSLIEKEGIDIRVLWDKIKDIVKKRDEEDLGFCFDDLDINSSMDDDLLTSIEDEEPTIEEVLNQLMVLDLTTNPDDLDNLGNQLRDRGLDYLVWFLESLTESEVMDYITEDISFDDTTTIYPVSDKTCDQELEIIDILESLGDSKKALISLNDFKEVCSLFVYVLDGIVYVSVDEQSMEFSRQDEELRDAILRELRSSNYSICDNTSNWVD